ncbi:MAG: lysozyme [Prevotella sp.]
MKSSELLLNKIIDFEGCKLTAYKCPAGVWTIGVGHTKGVKQGQKITEAQAISLLKGDLLPCEKYVNDLGVCKTQGQFDALVDFCFNLGTGALGRSTLLKFIRQGKAEQYIRGEFVKWVKSGGKTLAGLVKRRAWEADRYFGKSS